MVAGDTSVPDVTRTRFSTSRLLYLETSITSDNLYSGATLLSSCFGGLLTRR